jgi:predicted hydrolase (HD superfamily)
MKKLIALTVVMIALLTAVTANAEVYPAVGVVFDLDYENDLVVFEDFNQDLWVMEGIEDWDIGDIGALLMDDMGTETIYDDVIVFAHYAGYMPEEST